MHRCPQFQMRYPHFLHLATIFFNPSKPSNNMAITCSYCQKKFTSNRGLTQHQQRNEKCFRQLSAVAGTGPKPPQASCGVALSALNLAKQRQKEHYAGPKKGKKARKLGPSTSQSALQNAEFAGQYHSDNDDVGIYSDGSEEEEDVEEANSDDEEALGAPQIDESMLANFKNYVAGAPNLAPFTSQEVQAIKLMAVLRRTKASLDTYESVMEWHLKTVGALHEHESLSGYLRREKIFDSLKQRHNMDKHFNKQSQIVLPSSKAKVTIVKTKASMAIQQLLTDPRIRASDYLFFDDDPFKPPQQNCKIRDLNTGKAFCETYQKLITRPQQQVLLPTPFYIDGTVTGQFTALEISAVQISLGIFKRKARDRPYFWRTLGYIPHIEREKSGGKRMMVDSEHMDSAWAAQKLATTEGELLEGAGKVHPAQDFHTVLQDILESYVELQKTGFKWDLMHNGKLCKGVEFIPFVPFIKCDTKEADKFCASYGSRGHGVAQLCRYCECPTNESDNPKAHYRLKTVTKIKGLVARKDENALKNLSQQLIDNAWCAVRFGLHNKQGVHGACPMDMLHAMLLGIFKTVREEFFVQLGEDSVHAKNIDALAKVIGDLMARQSDRDRPKMKFGNGIRGGKIQAKDHTGILLVLLLVCCSGKGQEILSNKKSNFGPTYLQDWIMMLESLLQWGEWMRREEMERHTLSRARAKLRHLMGIIKDVAKRSKGMGLKTVKFHAIVHLVDDMLNFGVPLETDTGSNESGHKPAKMSARLTQKNKELFEPQTAKRLEELLLLQLAQEELSGRPLFNYFQGYSHPPDKAAQHREPAVKGAAIRCYRESDGHNYAQKPTKIDGKYVEIIMEQDLVDFVVGLREAVEEHIDDPLLYSVHEREGQIFRASSSFLGNVWRDWVIMDWGRDGELPNRLWGFLDLTELPPNSRIKYGGCERLSPAFYAIVESAELDPDTDELSQCEIVHKYVTETAAAGNEVGLKLYLADVEAILAPAMVIPDIGGKFNGYLLVDERAEWGKKFEEYLKENVGHQNESDEDEE